MLVMLPAISIDYPFLSEYSPELIYLAILGAPTFSASLEPLEPWNRLLFCWKSLLLKMVYLLDSLLYLLKMMIYHSYVYQSVVSTLKIAGLPSLQTHPNLMLYTIFT